MGYVVAVAGSLVAAALLALSTFDPATFAAFRLAVAELTTPVSSGFGAIGRGIISVPGRINDYFAVKQRNEVRSEQVDN